MRQAPRGGDRELVGIHLIRKVEGVRNIWRKAPEKDQADEERISMF